MVNIAEDSTVLRSTLHGLEQLGCQFVLLAGLESERPKTPIQKGWTAKRPSLDECAAHVEGGGQLGWVPKSMGLICVDVDGPRAADSQEVRDGWTPKDTAKLVRRVRKTIGDAGFVGEFPSLSALTKRNNKAHLVWKCQDGLDAPLGLKRDGKPYQTVNDTRFADTPGSWVDLKWGTQLQGLHYFADLLGRLTPAVINGRGTAAFETALALLRSHNGRPKPKFETAQLPALSGPVQMITGDRAAKLRESMLRKWPTPTEGSRHKTVRAWGRIAGGSELWLEGVVDYVRGLAAGLPADKLQELEAAIEAGRAEPMPPPPDGFKGTKKDWTAYDPPVSAYENDPEAQPKKGGGSQVQLYADTGCVGGSELDIAELYVAARLDADDMRINADNPEEFYQWDKTQRRWQMRSAGEILHELGGFARWHRDRCAEKHWLSFESARFAGGVLRFVSGDRRLYCKTDRVFDMNPDLIGLPNGTVFDIATGETRETAKADYVSRAVGLVPAAGPTTRFTKFLGETFVGDHEITAYILRFLGYMLTGHTAAQRALFFHGERGGGGKSTLLKIFLAVAGDYADSPDWSVFWQDGYRSEHPAELMKLRGLRAAIVDETPRGATRLREAIFNKFTAGGIIEGRYMRQNPVSFESVGKLIYASNFEPRLGDRNSGAARRVRMVEFDSRIGADETKLTEYLDRKIIAEEGPAILHFLLGQAHKWKQRGLGPTPAGMRRATEDLLHRSDDVEQFADECLEFASDGSALFDTLWIAWEAYRQKSRLRELNRRRFLRRLGGLYPDRVRREREAKGARRYYYVGVRLRESSEQALPGAEDGPAPF